MARLGGVPLLVEPIFLLVLVLLVVAGRFGASVEARAAFAGILLGSVFLHEAGHAFRARTLGLKVSGIYLHLVPFAYVERGAPRDELRVALAGPATSLVVAAVLALVPAVRVGFPPLDPVAWLAHAGHFALGVNLLMGLVNLLPIPPLDGGRALRAYLRAPRT